MITGFLRLLTSEHQYIDSWMSDCRARRRGGACIDGAGHETMLDSGCVLGSNPIKALCFSVGRWFALKRFALPESLSNAILPSCAVVTYISQLKVCPSA